MNCRFCDFDPERFPNNRQAHAARHYLFKRLAEIGLAEQLESTRASFGSSSEFFAIQDAIEAKRQALQVHVRDSWTEMGGETP